ncbi:MAG: hypothetical protein EXS13_09490 [Planctomycetes bacterium]|nr:hypothetical protein [Planctomycetota bacterium]
MRRQPNILRDVVILTLPFLAVAIYLWCAALASFWNAEIRNFHGERVRDLRVGTLRTMIQSVVRNTFDTRERRFQPLSPRKADAPAAAPAVDVFDLRIDGTALDALEADMPESARSRQKALLTVNDDETYEVDANWRGQRMDNYFFARKAWKLRTKKREFVHDQRMLNLTPLEDRLASLVTFELARETGLPAPLTRMVRLYVNLKDEGLYLLEEQVDESFVRRVGEMPGDLFYGELFVPDVPANSAWELSWNPYLWEKHDRWNKYDVSWRPWLSELLDAAHDPSPAGFDRLDAILDPSFARYYAVLCYLGDQHVDLAHNQKIGLDLLAGKLSGYLWNPLLNMPPGQGVESTANRLFLRLAQDPRFLDRVAAIVGSDFVASDAPARQLAVLDRAEAALISAGMPIDRWLSVAFRGLRNKLEERHHTVQMQHAVAEVAFEQEAPRGEELALRLSATAVASLRLTALHLEAAVGETAVGETVVGSLELFEDRDFDGRWSVGDRKVATRVEGRRLVVDDPSALLAVGRDFTAAYRDRPSEGQDTFSQHREFTRLAALESRFVLGAPGGTPPRVLGLDCERTVGSGAVTVKEGPPAGYRATDSVHPWRRAAAPAARVVEWSGSVLVRESLLLGPRDSLVIAAGAVVKLAPGVSIQVQSRVDWRDVRFERLDPARPFGVIALQGHGCDGSVIDHVTVVGGSEATVGYLYYSGMFSAHLVDRLTVRDSRFADNRLGDDSVRLGKCHDVVFERVRVERAIADAIDFDLCDGIARDIVVDQPLNDGIDMMTCRIGLERVEVIGAGDKGVSIGEGSHPLITDSVFRDCVTGLGIKDGSNPQIRDVLIEGCKTGVASYDKNWRYPGGGLGQLLRCTLRGNAVDVKLDDQSTLTLDQCTTEGKFDLPKKLKPGRFVVLPLPAEGTP